MNHTTLLNSIKDQILRNIIHHHDISFESRPNSGETENIEGVWKLKWKRGEARKKRLEQGGESMEKKRK